MKPKLLTVVATALLVTQAGTARAEGPAGTATPAASGTASLTATINQPPPAVDPLQATRDKLQQNLKSALNKQSDTGLVSQVLAPVGNNVWQTIRGAATGDMDEYSSVGSCVDAADQRAGMIVKVLQNMSASGELPYDANVFRESGYNFTIPFTGGEEGSLHTYNKIELRDGSGKVVDTIKVDDYLGVVTVSPGSSQVDPKSSQVRNQGKVGRSVAQGNAQQNVQSAVRGAAVRPGSSGGCSGGCR